MLTFTLLSLFATAAAAELPDGTAYAGFGRGSGSSSDDRDEQADDKKDDGADAKDDGKKKGKKKKKKKSKKQKMAGWTFQTYVTPGGGAQISEGGASVAAGGNAGVLYWRKGWHGDAYVGGTYLQGNDVTGFEGHVGNSVGVRRKAWGLDGGLEAFYEQQDLVGGGTLLPGALGVRTPVTLTVGPRKVYGFVGVAPTFLIAGDRQAADVAFGDEFEWSIGAGMRTKWAVGQIGLSTRTTSAGTITTPTVSFNFR